MKRYLGGGVKDILKPSSSAHGTTVAVGLVRVSAI